MTQPIGLLLCDDLIFASRITSTATAAGALMKVAKTPNSLLDFARQSIPRCVIIYLHSRDLDIARAMAELGGLTPKPFVVGYGSHVDTATLNAARAAGCDIVWPRSKFTQELETTLPKWFAISEVEA